MSHDPDHAAQQRADCIAFLLGGAGKARGEPSPQSRTPPSSPYQRSGPLGRTFRTAHSAFVSCFLQDWLATDKELEQCVGSIANLRARIRISSRRRGDMEESRALWRGGTDASLSWGYRRGHDTLTRDDVDLALTDELLQHERMMQLARRSIAALHQDQEALGRRLCELQQVLPSTWRCDPGTEVERLMVQCASAAEECRQVFVSASMELFRKQELIQQLLDSVDDTLVASDRDGHVAERTASSRSVAQTCAGGWSRSSPQSHLYRYSAWITRTEEVLQKQSIRSKD